MASRVEIAAFFGALSDESRLRILMLVRQIDLTVGELAQVMGQSQPRVSRHVKILDDAGIVSRRREGSWTFVEPGLEETLAILAMIERRADPDFAAACEADSRRLDAIREERAAAAARWFAGRADKWEDERALYVSETRIEEAIATAIGGHDVGRLVDVGTGTGRMLELFAPRAREAIGFDRSPDMLRLARVRMAEAGGKASLRQGDMFALPLDDRVADTLILHQVLHYAPVPRVAIDEAARVLAPGGLLLVVDFERHEREELRREHGHQRLGFADDTMLAWFRQAGLEPRAPVALEGGELTVKLWSAARPDTAKGMAA